MRRNKTVKRVNKRQSTKVNTATSVQKMEKDWMETPSKLAKQLDKEISAQQKQEKKLAKAVSKLAKSMQKSEARIAKAEKNKNPSMAKKKIKAAQKEFSANNKIFADLTKQLDAVSQTTAATVAKQAKLTALTKHISQFEKEWNKAAKTEKANAKPQKVKATSKGKASNKRKSSANPRTEPADAMFDDIGLEEIAELA